MRGSGLNHVGENKSRDLWDKLAAGFGGLVVRRKEHRREDIDEGIDPKI